ncbi:Lrp/AsnC family transcriptional regulator [Methanomicrobium antiquum]|jgi:DNA-binding Lrp family transcriptional regulator|uniref:Lrp/AsnC family transcriptional regulator n=1 Tax=Methanomicrobium antiquum TaxID=487686 RepID=A0AAF0FQ88_9EURY|nr:Lrp/AsnC family transcriptional regulator [Methanomicrobium antiquum]MDD3978470.1 Lrp/AsnC family transcriptional regulator [Methanomicrobium sp.]WFN36674.1 Lrp/AsnC family transcriptional regulator [Methanomicrobium antiquum]
MDDKDRMILGILEDDCRIPAETLADMVDLEVDDIKKRIAVLEENGVIKKYMACIDWEKAGEGVVAAIIELKVSPERDYGYDKIAERISRHRQVKSLRLISGAYDLELLVVAKNIHEITRFVAEQIAPLEQVRETGTILIMKTYKENGLEFFERKTGDRLTYSF